MDGITPREKEVLTLIAYEHSSKEIANRLYVSYETVNSHRKNIMSKLQVKNTAGMIRVGFQKGILQIMGFLLLLIIATNQTSAQTIGLHVDPAHTVLVGQDTSGAGPKMIWYANKDGAFRSGYVSDLFGNESTYWNPSNVGNISTAFGINNLGSGFTSMSWGAFNSSTGSNSTTWGQYNNATSFSETVFGRFAIESSKQMPGSWDGDDQLMAIGNGTGFDGRNNALTILKKGHIGINHPLPEAMLHIDSVGTPGERTILLALSANNSKRPSIQFSENYRAGGPTSGMSIEYDGLMSGTENRININDTNSDPVLTVKNDGDTEIKGFTKLGSEAPAIKFKKIETTQTLSTGLSVVLNHGLAGAKILDISAIMRVAEVIGQSTVNYIIPANSPFPTVHNSSSNYEYAVYGDDNLLYFRAIGSSAVGDRNITVTIMYEE